MKFKSLILICTLSMFLISCNKESPTDNSKLPSADNNLSYSNELPLTLSLTESTSVPSAYSKLGKTIIFPDKENNNNLSFYILDDIEKYIPSNKITTSYPYSTTSLCILDDVIYFNNTSDNNSLYSLEAEKETVSQINNLSIRDLTSDKEFLYFINASNDNCLSAFNVKTKKTSTIIKNKVGNYILNNNNILYQNQSDNNSLYVFNLDTKKHEKLTTTPVESFDIYKNSILYINPIDNNSIYSLDPTTLKITKLLSIKGKSLKALKDKLYYIDKDSNDKLKAITLNDSNELSSQETIISTPINNFTLLEEGIFYEKKANVNITYFHKF